MLKLMPLGGSITYGVGSSHGQGYRHHLCRLLVANGFDVTMIGSRGAGTMESSAHEGGGAIALTRSSTKHANQLPH